MFSTHKVHLHNILEGYGSLDILTAGLSKLSKINVQKIKGQLMSECPFPKYQ